MFQKLFNISVVVFLVIVSLVVVVFLSRGLFSTLTSPLLTDSSGISVVAGGVSEKWLRLVFLVTVLIGVSYFYWRGRRNSR